jgi:hypothetical protein
MHNFDRRITAKNTVSGGGGLKRLMLELSTEVL